jgi:hypothetical protein
MGLCLAMGILRLPARSNYWRLGRWLLKTQFGFVMPRDQYDLLWRYMHFQDNEERSPTRDPIWKLRRFVDTIVSNSQRAYTPSECVAVDESMVKFKGRLSFRQYLPSKPIKWGINAWCLCEFSTRYSYNIQVYTGKVDGVQEKGLSHRVVMDMASPILGRNMRLFMDNFYTSVNLLNALRIRGVMACGTIRANRTGLPTGLKSTVVRFDKHQYKVAQKDDLVFCVWKDTKVVQCMSNYHDPKATGFVRRHVAGERVDVPVPKIIQDYQQNMRGVDLMDQMVGYYIPDHRSKWWRRLFFYLTQVAIHNAYIIAKDQGYESYHKRWGSFQLFVEELIEDLIGNTLYVLLVKDIQCII